MKINLKCVKQTKAKLNLNPDCAEIEPQTPKRNLSADSKKEIRDLVPSLKEQVNKFSERLERMIEQRHQKEIVQQKDQTLMMQIE